MDLDRYYCWLFFICCCLKEVKDLPLTKEDKRGNKSIKMSFNQPTSLFEVEGNYKVDVAANISKIRVKRNGGAGKFVEAASMPQIKMVRLFLQMAKNLYDPAYIGGPHAFHRDVPKAIIKIYKEKIVDFFMPDIGQESKV